MLQFETLFGLEPLPILIIYLDEFPSGQMRQGEDVQIPSRAEAAEKWQFKSNRQFQKLIVYK